MKRGSLQAAPLVLPTGLAELGVVAKDVTSIRGRLDQCILEKHMNQSQTIKDIKKNQAGVKESGEVATVERRATPATFVATIATDSTISHARDAYNLASVARSFIHDNIAPVMSAIVALSDFDSLDVGQNRQRLRLINNLARLGGELVTDAETSMESEQDEMHAKLMLLEGGAA